MSNCWHSKEAIKGIDNAFMQIHNTRLNIAVMANGAYIVCPRCENCKKPLCLEEYTQAGLDIHDIKDSIAQINNLMRDFPLAYKTTLTPDLQALEAPAPKPPPPVPADSVSWYDFVTPSYESDKTIRGYALKPGRILVPSMPGLGAQLMNLFGLGYYLLYARQLPESAKQFSTL